MQKVTVDGAPLSEVVQWVRRAALVRGLSLPILESVLLKAQAGRLYVQGTNLDTYATAWLPCQGDLNPVCINAGQLGSSLGSKGPIELEVEIQDGTPRLHVRDGVSDVVLCTVPVEDMPTEPGMEKNSKIEPFGWSFDPGHAFHNALAGASWDEIRPEFCGVFLEVKQDRCHLTGTNGRRMHHDTITSGIWAVPSSPVLIPAVSLHRVLTAGLAGKASKRKKDPKVLLNVSLIGKSYVQFSYPTGKDLSFGNRATMRLLEIPFPDYNRVIPTISEERFKIEAERLSDVTSRALPHTDRLTHQVKISVSPAGIKVSAEHQGLGTFEQSITPISWNPDPFVVVFNGSYLRDALLVFPGEVVSFSQDQNIVVGMLRTDTDPDRWVLIMPVRLPETAPKEHKCPECGAVTEEGGCPTCNPPCPNAEENTDVESSS